MLLRKSSTQSLKFGRLLQVSQEGCADTQLAGAYQHLVNHQGKQDSCQQACGFNHVQSPVFLYLMVMDCLGII